ncbi:hypothetical protein GCM10023220_17670 [Streptomyces ziwulingensis]|uniref:Phosphodiester glycosidase domain-containing protein n=1 Tax=Streptomyces ziwulingensis TaxID=1045501 RepID=A0ABP9B9L4_9ACTN
MAFGTLTGAALVGAAPAAAARGAAEVAPGVTYDEFDVEAAKGTTHVHVLAVDLGEPRVRLGLLYPGTVAARATVSGLAGAQRAVGGVNGDFFHLTESSHPGVAATGASVGPAVAEGKALKAAVPKGQRFGPKLPSGTSTEDVFAVGTDRRARLDRLALDGSLSTPQGTVPLGGLNQYALPVGSVGAFTSVWGAAARKRATCGTDTDRAAPCSTETYEVTVRDGRVVSTSEAPGSGPIEPGTTVLVGREAGAERLRELATGQAVEVTHRLVASGSQDPLDFAVGGYPVLSGGSPLPGLDATTSAVRTAVGVADGGRRVLLLAVDGAAAYRSGLTIAEVAKTLSGLGASDGFNLDGGGSSTLVARNAGADQVTVRNHPSGGTERAVPNGIGVFSTA